MTRATPTDATETDWVPRLHAIAALTSAPVATHAASGRSECSQRFWDEKKVSPPVRKRSGSQKSARRFSGG